MDLDDDSFSDPELDNISDNVLAEIEEHAILSTQRQINRRLPDPHGRANTGYNASAYDTAGEVHPLNDENDTEEVINLNAQVHDLSRPQTDEATQREIWRSNRYGARVAPAHQLQSTSPQPSLPARYPLDNHDTKPTSGLPLQAASNASQIFSQTLNTPGDITLSQLKSSQLDPKTKIERLLARVRDLEQEKLSLRAQAEDAKATVLSKTGEIAIVRANHDKTAKDFERRLAALRQQHTDEINRSRIELEATRKEREKVETSNKFLEHDLAQETEKARQLRRRTIKDGSFSGTKNARTGAQTRESPMSTPRKMGSFAYRDGFDDAEVALVSPSKINERNSRGPAGTPKAGGKRKRVQQTESFGSPKTNVVPPLEIDEFNSFNASGREGSTVNSPARLKESLGASERDGSQDLNAEWGEKLDVMKQILNHRQSPTQPRTVEMLSKYTLSETPTRAIASAIYEHFEKMPTMQDVEAIRLQFCETLLDLWSQCLKKEMYDPLKDLTEFLKFVINVSPTKLCIPLVPKLVKLATGTADLVAFPRAKAYNEQQHGQAQALSKVNNAGVDETRLRKPVPEHLIRPLDYLQLLHSVAVNVSLHRHTGALQTFWANMEFDFVLLMLHRVQPLNEIIVGLQLLGTSALPMTFGAIFRDQTLPQQKKFESGTVDRLTVLLFETIIPPSSAASPSSLKNQKLPKTGAVAGTEISPWPQPLSKDVLRLRFSVLSLLREISTTAHGGALLASHRLIIGRLVRFLHDAVVNMYNSALNPDFSSSEASPREKQAESRPGPDSEAGQGEDDKDKDEDRDEGDDDEDDVSAAHNQLVSPATLVNMTTHLLFRLTSVHRGDVGDIRTKLGTIPSGAQKYLIALSRIAFAEGLTELESGIDAEASEAAHAMLDELLSPEEGEEVIRVFSSGGTGTATATATATAQGGGSGSGTARR